MSAILDVIVVLIIAITVFVCGKNGFFKSLIKVGSVIAAIIIVVIFHDPLQDKLLASKTSDNIKEFVNGKLAEFVVSDTESYDPEEVKETPKFIQLLETLGIDSEELEAKWQNWKTQKTDVVRKELVDFISDPLMKAITSVISFVILFFGSIIILRLVGFVLDKIFTLPVLHQANTILGVVLGIVIAFIYVSAFCFLVKEALPYFQAQEIEFVTKIQPDETLIFKWFSEHDIISLITK